MIQLDVVLLWFFRTLGDLLARFSGTSALYICVAAVALRLWFYCQQFLFFKSLEPSITNCTFSVIHATYYE